MNVLVEQIEGVKFSVQARSHTVICDQPEENGGSNEGMTPPEFLLASVGACAGFYGAEYLRSRNLATSGVKVSVLAEKLKGPARLGDFRIRVDCPTSLTTEQREGLMRAIEHCLIKNTLLHPPKIEISLEIPSPIGAGI